MNPTVFRNNVRLSEDRLVAYVYGVPFFELVINGKYTIFRWSLRGKPSKHTFAGKSWLNIYSGNGHDCLYCNNDSFNGFRIMYVNLPEDNFLTGHAYDKNIRVSDESGFYPIEALTPILLIGK